MSWSSKADCNNQDMRNGARRQRNDSRVSPEALNKTLDCYRVGRPKRRCTRTASRSIGRAQEVEITYLRPEPQTREKKGETQSTQVEEIKGFINLECLIASRVRLF